MEYGNEVLNDNGSRSKKLWMLLEYLIAFRGSSISQNDLIELLWPSEDIDDPVNALKAIIHRVRVLVSRLGLDGKKLIAYQRGGYTWNPEGLTVVIDTDEFEAACRQAESAKDRETRLACLMRALDIYKGSFLPQTSLEPWAIPIGTYFHLKYIAAAKEAVALLESERRFDEVIAVCQRAITIDPYEESLQIPFIRSLAGVGQAHAAVAQYERVSDLLYTHFGVTPSPEFLALYKEIIKTSKAVEQDLTSIKTTLEEVPQPHAPGGFGCELESFSDIYRLELRTQERYGQVSCLCLLTVFPAGGTHPSQKILQASMEKVTDAVRASLRQNDVFTRFSESQFLLLLVGTTLEDAEIVAERILRQFKHENPHFPVTIRYRLQTISAVDVRN